MNVLTRRQAADAKAAAGSSPPAGRADDDASACLRRAVDALLTLQHPHGWWKGELETNVTIDAEDLLLREFLGIRTVEVTQSSARWIRSRQREDGTWANFYGGPPDLSTTVEAYVALRLAGDPVDAAHLQRAAQFIQSSGGVERTRVFTRIWMALFGLWPWVELPVLPAELIFLPSFVPLNIYDFGCWARQTVVALTVVSAHRPAHELRFGIDELRSGLPEASPAPLSTWPGRFQALDRLLKAYERHPVKFVRQAALRRAERWIVQRQEADGSWGGIQPPWVYSLIALRLQGYALEHPVMRAGIEGLDGFTIEDDDGRRIEACQSPVWDTALAVTALADAGLQPTDPVLRKAARYLLDEEISVKGDWSVRRPGLAPAGWAFEFANDNYPDIDDTAEVVMALGRTDEPAAGALDRAVAWIEGMQCRDGGWGAFDVDNTQTLCRELPFCDFGELIDPPSADVTAHVVEMLAKLGGSKDVVELGVRVAVAGSGGRRVLVRALGREPRLRHGRCGPGAHRRRVDSRRPRSAPGRRLAGRPPEPRWRLGRGPALVQGLLATRPGAVDGIADGLGPAGAPGRGRALRGDTARCGLPRRDPARRRLVGRAVVHGNRLSRRLLHQLPPVSACVPGHGPGAFLERRSPRLISRS